MNRTIRDVLLFAAGFAAGAYVMHTVFRTKYQEYADAQIDDTVSYTHLTLPTTPYV